MTAPTDGAGAPAVTFLPAGARVPLGAGGWRLACQGFPRAPLTVERPPLAPLL